MIKSAELTSPRLRVPARLSQFRLHYDPSGISLPPATIVFGAPEAKAAPFISIRPPVPPITKRPPSISAGNLPQVRDLIATASALGWNISRGWDLSGPVRCDLRWPARSLSKPWKSQPVGTIEWGTETGNATLLTPFLNHPVLQIRARADLKSDSRHIAWPQRTLSAPHWTGAFDHRDDGARLAIRGYRRSSSPPPISIAG